MRTFRWVVLVVVVGLAVMVGHAQPPSPQGVFHTGATAGIVRDATKVGNTIYAVGTWVNCGDFDNNPATPCTTRIDGALWTFDGANAPTRTALPDIANNGQNLAAGDAITPDAAYIANQVRTSAAPTAARVSRDPLTNLLTNVDLTPTATYSLTTYAARQARSISDNGSVLYGQVNKWLGLFNPNATKIFQSRVMRFDVANNIVTGTEIYPQPATNAGGFVTFQAIQPRAISSDGSVAIGQTFSSAPFTDTQVFRYVQGSGVTNVSLLPGGTWNSPIALTDDGKTVVAVGPSTDFPNREVYLADYSTGSEGITRLGSPNEPWAFGAGGITGNGAVVAITSTIGCNPNICRYGYFHNSNGWFQLTTAMAAAGMNLTGWQHFQVQGMSTDGTMVWGSGFHNGAEEGYVAEFPADFLKNFDVVPAAPTDASIVGVWAADGTGNPSTSNPASVAVFMADGTYYQIGPTGFERGSYEFDGSSLTPTTRLDTNGDDGLSDANGSVVSASVVGDELRSPANCVYDINNPDACFVAHRIPGSAGQIDGGWVLGDPTQNDSSAVFILTASGKYFMAQDGDPALDPGGRDGIEIGTIQWDPTTHVVSLMSISTDTNDQWGLSNSVGAITAMLSSDELQLIAGDSTGLNTFIRIVDPASVVPTVTGDSVSGVEGSSFSYAVAATRALTFSASGLPSGLSIDQTTGVISGTPTSVWGPFDVTVTATNTFGDQGIGQIQIQVDDLAPPVITGTPANISVAPTGQTGAVVTFTSPTATDTRDGSVPVVCSPASGSTFAKGTTQVICTATDAAGNVDSTAFFVTVGQQSAPSFMSLPLSEQFEASGPAGAVVTYNPAPAAQDALGQPLAVTCTPASGSTLPLGQTKVTCSATDALGQTVSAQFTETVVDTVAPTFTYLPGPVIQVEATSNKGAVVSYPAPTVVDLVDPLPTMKCDKPSGQTYPIGPTVVSCTTADRTGNSRTSTFTISVVDTTAPTIVISKPVATSYKKGQKLAANYTCADTGSGIASCAGSVPDGGTVDTSVSGTFTFVVTAIDKSGNVTTASVIYTIR